MGWGEVVIGQDFLRFTLIVEAELRMPQFGKTRGISKMSEWSRNLSGRIREQWNQKASDNALFVERQRLKQVHGPSLWQDIMRETTKCCDDLNKDMGRKIVIIEESSNQWIRVSVSTPTGFNRLCVNFNNEASLLNWKTDSDSKARQYKVSIDHNGDAAFYLVNEEGEVTVPSRVQSIAEGMLNALFD